MITASYHIKDFIYSIYGIGWPAAVWLGDIPDDLPNGTCIIHILFLVIRV